MNLRSQSNHSNLLTNTPAATMDVNYDWTGRKFWYHRSESVSVCLLEDRKNSDGKITTWLLLGTKHCIYLSSFCVFWNILQVNQNFGSPAVTDGVPQLSQMFKQSVMWHVTCCSSTYYMYSLWKCCPVCYMRRTVSGNMLKTSCISRYLLLYFV